MRTGVLYKAFLFCVDVGVWKKEYSYTCNATKNWKDDIMMQSLKVNMQTWEKTKCLASSLILLKVFLK